jgi:chemotaxis-related protein WspD
VTTPLPTTAASTPAMNDCWNRIGVWGDKSCPELVPAVHCQNCPVFTAASTRFLDAPSPKGYLEEWTQRLIAPIEETARDLQSVLIFRVGEEWLALPVPVLIEVTIPRPIHRLPHRGGLLAGLVNIRGELQLCVHLAQVLGGKAVARDTVSADQHLSSSGQGHHSAAPAAGARSRMLVVQAGDDRWVFPVDEVDQVYRFPAAELTTAPATLARSSSHLTRGVFPWQERSVGYLDEARLFQLLRARIR